MLNVLYVDDDPHLLEIARFFLEASGDFSVATATLATEALKLPNFASYDAIISDYEMPRMNGIAFLKNVREVHGDIPFILFTGKGREEVVIEAINNGADFYLQKGGDPTAQFAELAHKIKKAVERKRAADAIKENEHSLRINQERLVMAQQLGHIGSWVYDPRTNRIWGSAEGLRIFGYPPVAGDFPLDNIEACIPERERIHQALVDLITTGQEYNLEFAINPADGSASKVIHSKARLEKDTEGKPLRIIGVMQDITERKRAVEEIAFKNVILSTQQETSLDGILIVDEHGKILHFNQKFTGIWGIPEDLIASRIDEPVLQHVVGQLADPEAFLFRVQYLYDHKDEKSFEELLLKDGRILERFSAPMWGEPGKYYGRVWYFRDITGRKRAEENLTNSEQRFHNLYTHLIEGAALHELTYNDRGIPEDYIIVDVNPAFEKHIGISRETVIGKTSREAFGVIEPPYLEIYARVALTGTPEVFETYFPPMDKYFSISVYCPAKGSFATIFEDITKRKRAEDELRESEQRFRQVFDTLPLGMWIADKNGTLVMGNAAGQKIWEANPQIGQEEYGVFKAWRLPSREPIRPDDWALGYAVNEGRVTEKELLEIEAFDGSHKFILNWAAPVKNSDGEITGAFVLNQDITDIVRADRAVQESEERYRTYIDNSPLGIFIVDESGHYRDVNPTGSSMLGYSRKELLNLSITDIIPADTRTKVLTYFSDLQKTGTLTTELSLLKKSGDSVPVILNAVRLPDRRFMAFCTDITERKQAEGKIWTGREILEGILNSIPVRVFWKDRDLTFIGCNLPFARDAGFEKPGDIIGKDDFAMGWREQAELYRNDDRSVIASGIPKRLIEESQTTPSGDIITILTSKIPLRDAEGNITGVLGTYIEITERKQAETALRQSEEKNRLTLEATRDGIWDWNIPTGNVFFSPRWYTMLGYEPDELPGSYATWESLIHPDDLDLTLRDIRNYMEKKDEFYSIEFRMRTKQGDWKWIMARGKVVERNSDGSPVRMVGTHTDISERKQAEKALAEANRKLTLLSGITRHDITNQLTVLKGYHKMLEQKISDPRFTEYFQKIAHSAQRITAMIQFTGEYEEIGINAPVWQDCHTIVDTAAKQSPLNQVIVKNDLPAGAEVFADPLVTKVCYNLIDNAVRHGGRITTIRFSVQVAGEDLLIVCEDDGKGIPADQKEQIFEHSFGNNTGMGLFLIREILSITGIRIRETGEPGKGARFEIVIPKSDYRMNPDAGGGQRNRS